MDSSQTTLLQHQVFPRHSINIVVGPTHIGKTFFVTQLVNNYKVYFCGPIDRIFIVLCNERVHPLVFKPDLDISVEQIPLSEYDPQLLEPNDLVIVDDLQKVTFPIRETLTVGAHHYDLVSLFIITHDIVGSVNFELIRKTQRILLFMNAFANVRQLKFLITHFFHGDEIKNYLQTISQFCQSEKEVLALELSPITTSENHGQHVILAFSHITSLIDKGFYLLYPFPYWGKQYIDNFYNMASGVERIEHFPYTEMPPNVPESTLVAVPMAAVIKASPEKKEVKCSDKQMWEDTIREIEENIESYFPPPRWQKIKNLAKEILRNNQFCVKTDGKTFHLKDRPRTQVSLIDFLAVVTRRAGPMEQQRDPIWKVYALHVDALLKNNAPKDLFKNQLLVPRKYQ